VTTPDEEPQRTLEQFWSMAQTICANVAVIQPDLTIGLAHGGWALRKPEAEAVGLKEQSPIGLNFSSKSFALSARRLQPRATKTVKGSHYE
jgi:hypothetical protein